MGGGKGSSGSQNMAPAGPDGFVFQFDPVKAAQFNNSPQMQAVMSYRDTESPNSRSATGEAGPASSGRDLSKGYGAALGALLGATAGPAGAFAGAAYGSKKGAERFDTKAAKDLGISLSDYGLGVKHKQIDAKTGKAMGAYGSLIGGGDGDDNDDGGYGGLGGSGSSGTGGDPGGGGFGHGY